MKILAITSCPNGIAHTYMAQEKLEQAAKEMGVDIKVETQGGVGAENILTAKEIKEADGIIIAADRQVIFHVLMVNASLMRTCVKVSIIQNN